MVEAPTTAAQKESPETYSRGDKSTKSDWDDLLGKMQKGSRSPKSPPFSDLEKNSLLAFGEYLHSQYASNEETTITAHVDPLYGNSEVTMRMKGFFLHATDDKPAVIERRGGVVLQEGWYQNGIPHRENGPALVVYSDLGHKMDEIFVKNGKIEKSIAYLSDGFYKVVSRNTKDGSTIMESYDKDGKLHAEGVPARKIVSRGGELELCEFFQHGIIHNTLEPARQSSKGDEYFVNGVKYTLEEFKEYKTSGKKFNNNAPKTSTMKDKLGKAGTRIATRKLVKGLQNLLADQMTSNIKNAKTRSAAKEGILSFLESEAGKGALGILLGSLLPYAKSLPMISKHSDKLDAVAEEFQVEGLAVVGEFAVDQLAELVGPATSLIQAYLESVSTEETTKVRVDATATDTVKHEEHEEEAVSHKEKLSKNKK